MNTTFTIIVLAIVAVAIVLLVSNRIGNRRQLKRLQKMSSTVSSAERSDTQWRAVKIEPGLICCEAAVNLADKVFLSKESPHLPLEGCVEKDCRCRYIHLEDRRSGDDRRIELGDLGAFLPVSETERRQVSGRRATDLTVSF